MARYLSPRRFLRPKPVRYRSLALCVFFVLAICLCFRFYAGANTHALGCQNSSLWNCRLTKGGKVSPIIKTDTSPYVSSVPPEKTLWYDEAKSWMNGALGRTPDRPSGPAAFSHWTYEKDADNLFMTSRQCQSAFPGLFGEITRARAQYQRFSIIKDDLDALHISDGRVRAAILDGRLSILKTNLKTQLLRAKAVAILESLQDAISGTRRGALPNIEFIISVESQVPDLAQPLWVPDRREEDGKVWLMPDSRYVIDEFVRPATDADAVPSARRKDRRWRWGSTQEDTTTPTAKEERRNVTMVRATPRTQLVAEIEDLEVTMPYAKKRDRLVGVWRNDNIPNNARRKDLARVANGQAWAETGESPSKAVVGGLNNRNDTGSSTAAAAKGNRRSSITDICRHSFLAHDTSFPISLADGPLLCSSVIVTTRPKWIRIYHGLMFANNDRFHMGSKEHPVVEGWAKDGAGVQNVVVVDNDWADLGIKMTALMKHPEVAREIALNSVDTFRKRYLTNAASACYWREMIYAYKSVSFEPQVWVEEPVAGGGTRKLRKGLSWESFLLLDDAAQMEFDEASFR